MGGVDLELVDIKNLEGKNLSHSVVKIFQPSVERFFTSLTLAVI